MNARQPPLQSFVSFRNSQGELSRGTLLKLENATVVFEVYNPYSIVQLSEVLQELSIRRADVLAYKGRAVVTNLVNTGLMLIVSANLLDPWTTIPDLREDVAQIRKDAERFVVDAAASVKIRYGYRVAVGELRSFLSDLNRWLEEVEVALLLILIEFQILLGLGERTFGLFNGVSSFDQVLLRGLELA